MKPPTNAGRAFIRAIPPATDPDAIKRANPGARFGKPEPWNLADEIHDYYEPRLPPRPALDRCSQPVTAPRHTDDYRALSNTEENARGRIGRARADRAAERAARRASRSALPWSVWVAMTVAYLLLVGVLVVVAVEFTR